MQITFNIFNIMNVHVNLYIYFLELNVDKIKYQSLPYLGENLRANYSYYDDDYCMARPRRLVRPLADCQQQNFVDSVVVSVKEIHFTYVSRVLKVLTGLFDSYHIVQSYAISHNINNSLCNMTLEAIVSISYSQMIAERYTPNFAV